MLLTSTALANNPWEQQLRAKDWPTMLESAHVHVKLRPGERTGLCWAGLALARLGRSTAAHRLLRTAKAADCPHAEQKSTWAALRDAAFTVGLQVTAGPGVRVTKDELRDWLDKATHCTAPTSLGRRLEPLLEETMTLARVPSRTPCWHLQQLTPSRWQARLDGWVPQRKGPLFDERALRDRRAGLLLHVAGKPGAGKLHEGVAWVVDGRKRRVSATWRKQLRNQAWSAMLRSAHAQLLVRPGDPASLCWAGLASSKLGALPLAFRLLRRDKRAGCRDRAQKAAYKTLRKTAFTVVLDVTSSADTRPTTAMLHKLLDQAIGCGRLAPSKGEHAKVLDDLEKRTRPSGKPTCWQVEQLEADKWQASLSNWIGGGDKTLLSSKTLVHARFGLRLTLSSNPIAGKPFVTSARVTATTASATEKASEKPAVKATPKHPLEDAMTLVCNPIRQRKVVRVGRERADVWLFSGRSFDALKQRIGRIIDAALELPSGHRLQRWGAMDDANTFEIQVKGSEVARVRIHRHLDGALVIIAGIAKTAKMPPWISPYRPAPVNLPHGPLR